MQPRCLIVGLGNPGKKYHETRHNIGFMVIDEIADSLSVSVDKNTFNAQIGQGVIEDIRIILVKPQSFMNLSGQPVRRLADYYRIQGRDMVVIHDDIDLAFGRIKIKEKGGHGGHKGIKSLSDTFGGGEFVRVRMGVGRSDSGIEVSNYVLGKFSKQEQKELQILIQRGKDAVISVLCRGTKESMNQFNIKNL